MKTLITAVILASLATPVLAAPVCELPWNYGSERCRKWREGVENKAADVINSVANYQEITFYTVSEYHKSKIAEFTSGVRFLGAPFGIDPGEHNFTTPVHDGWGKLDVGGVQCGVRNGQTIFIDSDGQVTCDSDRGPKG